MVPRSPMHRSQRDRKPPKRDYDTPRQLISSVREEQVLWDDRWPGYKDSNERELAWKRIAKRFYGLSAAECQNAWESLRRARSNNRRRKQLKIRSGSSSAAARKVRPFAYEEEMDFLDTVKQREKQEGNLCYPEDSGEDKENAHIGNVDGEPEEVENDNGLTGLDYSVQQQLVDDMIRGEMYQMRQSEEEDEEFVVNSKTPRKALATLQPSAEPPMKLIKLPGVPIARSSSIDSLNAESFSFGSANFEGRNPSFDELSIADSIHSEVPDPGDADVSGVKPSDSKVKSSCVPKPGGKTRVSKLGEKRSLLKCSGKGTTTKTKDTSCGSKLLSFNKHFKLKGAGKKKVTGHKSDRQFDELSVISEEDEDEPEVTQDVLRGKVEDKMRAKISAQEAFHNKREERRQIIADKIRKARLTPNFSYSQSDMRGSPLELAYAHELMSKNEFEEDHMTLFCMSLAPRLKALTLKVANRLTSEFMRLLSEAEERESSVHDSEEYQRKYNTSERKNEPTLLTPEIMDVVNDVLSISDNDVAANNFDMIITGEDIHLLLPLKWLNDKIINFYMSLINERSRNFGGVRVFAFNSFFFLNLLGNGYNQVASWTKNVDIFSFDLLIVPIHNVNHWCVTIIDMKEKSVTYYDSLKYEDGYNEATVSTLLAYLWSEMKAKKHEPFKASYWKGNPYGNGPRQSNGSDCGVIVCALAECVARGSPIAHVQPNDMDAFRNRMVYEIKCSRLVT